MKSTRAIGMMSGTSHDGVDLAACVFSRAGGKWSYEVLHAETVPYSDQWKERLIGLVDADALSFVETDAALGKFFGEAASSFIKKTGFHPDVICSHGHTIFHQPEKGFTSQIGSGAYIAAATGVDTVCDFRTKDVACGGQGAPLVPYGEQLLFDTYKFCLNLGGIANITCNSNDTLSAFDVCIANMALNDVVQRTGRSFDENGIIASQGKVITDLLSLLNEPAYYSQSPPKSLGREWYLKHMHHIIMSERYEVSDVLRTICEYAGMQIGNAVNRFFPDAKDQMLVTGGGAFNNTLVNCIRKYSKAEVVTPDSMTIAFKEAIIFGLLGVLYMNEEINISHKVTGSSRSHIGGALYKGK